jgi:UDP-N-acetylglucosamine--N-acetylmuramyl-(pentapeptide) pyrophosphoryl-undecaprenol N-acetylglucosamine transferase
LVPYPFAAGNHQELNARRLHEIGAAKMILDHELKGEALATAIREMYMDRSSMREMQRNSKSVGRTDACTKVADIAMSLIRQFSASARIGSHQPKGAG